MMIKAKWSITCSFMRTWPCVGLYQPILIVSEKWANWIWVTATTAAMRKECGLFAVAPSGHELLRQAAPCSVLPQRRGVFWVSGADSPLGLGGVTLKSSSPPDACHIPSASLAINETWGRWEPLADPWDLGGSHRKQGEYSLFLWFC